MDGSWMDGSWIGWVLVVGVGGGYNPTQQSSQSTPNSRSGIRKLASDKPTRMIFRNTIFIIGQIGQALTLEEEVKW